MSDQLASVDLTDDCDLDLFDDASSQGSDSSLDALDVSYQFLPSGLLHSDDNFLTACLLRVDPIIRALYGLDSKLRSVLPAVWPL